MGGGAGSSERELEQRLAEAVEQQAATSHILRIISQSPTDVQPVFDIIAERAGKLCARGNDAPRVQGRLLDGAAWVGGQMATSNGIACACVSGASAGVGSRCASSIVDVRWNNVAPRSGHGR